MNLDAAGSFRQDGGRVCTPQPHVERRDRTRSLIYDLRAEARDHRDEADDLDSAAGEIEKDGNDRAAFVAKAKAFRRRSVARRLFLIADHLEDWANGRESLSTVTIEGKSFNDIMTGAAG